MSEKRFSIVLVVEGETEEYFYSSILKFYKFKQDKIYIDFKIINPKGIGKFSNKALRKYDNYIEQRGKDIPTYVFLCYDNDVFKYASKPPFDYGELSKQYSQRKNTSVYRIVAKESIEDWFLTDINSIFNYLKLTNKKTKNTGSLEGKTGEEKLNKLFRRVNKMYIKGNNPDSGKFIDSLDLNVIVKKNEIALKCLFDVINGL